MAAVRSAVLSGVVALAVLAAFAGAAQMARAEGGAAADVGYDISWPQCPQNELPTGPLRFAVIGVNGGRAYTVNPCLRPQWRWAAAGELPAAVYINLNYPREFGPESDTGPAGRCLDGDLWCRTYNFGYNAADFAVKHARSQGVTAQMWWLDVEAENYWSPDTELNTRIIAAAVEYFRERAMALGAYSTPYQWGEIAGEYAPGLPAWTAGATGIEMAKERCTPRYAFAGGPVVLVQYVEQFDTNYLCPGRAAEAGLERGRPRPAAMPPSVIQEAAAIVRAVDGNAAAKERAEAPPLKMLPVEGPSLASLVASLRIPSFK